MPASLPPLDVLRQQIDDIDDAMHDLLMQRATLIEGIRAAKPAGRPTLRPGREAIILRRLLARHGGAYPAQALIRLWREMMGSFAAMQGEVTVAMPAALERTARRHFGGAFVYRAVAGDAVALNMVMAGGATIAVLPWPSAAADWWLRLCEVEGGPRIVAAIPFLVRRADHESLVVGNIDFEPTGDDTTLLVVPDGQKVLHQHRILVTAEGKSLVEVASYLSKESVAAIPDAVYLGLYATPYQSPE